MARAILSDGSISVILNVVETESPDYSNTVTDNPVEEGVNVSDHIKNESVKFSISGVVVGDDAAQKLSKLRGFRDNKKILTYTGRNVYTNLVIESLSTEHPKNIRNGFSFSIRLKQIRIAKVQFVTLTNVKAKPKLATKTSKGKQTTKTKEDANVKTALANYGKKKAGA